MHHDGEGITSERAAPTGDDEQQFDHWLREQFKGLLGWNVQEILLEPVCDLIFT